VPHVWVACFVTGTLMKLLYFAIIRVKILGWQIWVYNNNFLLHLVVIIAVIHCCSSSHEVIVRHCHHTSHRTLLLLWRHISLSYAVVCHRMSSCNVTVPVYCLYAS